MIRRVRSRISGPLMRMPSCAPRPVPTMSAVGVASPSAHGHAMISTATAAENAAVASPVTTSQPTSVASESASTIGTKTLDTRSTSRWIGAFPDCASATSLRDLRERRLLADLRRAHDEPAVRVDRRPGDGAPGATSTGTGSPVSIDWSTADSPSTTTPSVATFSPGRTTKRSPTASSSIGTDTSIAVAEDASLLRAELEQRPDRGARAPPRASLEVAAEQDQRRDDRGDLEVDVRVVDDDERDDRPAPGGERADRDQRVHRRRAVACVQERPRGGSRSRPRRRPASRARTRATPSRRTAGGIDHREHDERRREGDRDDEPPADRVRRGRPTRRPRPRAQRGTRRPRPRRAGRRPSTRSGSKRTAACSVA